MNYAILYLLLLSSLPSLAMSTESLWPEREDVDDDIPAPNEPTEDVVNNGTLDTGTSTPENVVKARNVFVGVKCSNSLHQNCYSSQVNVRAKRQDDQQTPDVDENSGNNIDPPPGSSSSEDHTTSTTYTYTYTCSWTGWKASELFKL
jgi:hypothetical protein